MSGKPACVFLSGIDRAARRRDVGGESEFVGTKHSKLFSKVEAVTSGAEAPFMSVLKSRLKPRPTNRHTDTSRLKFMPDGASSAPTRKRLIVGRSRANGELDFAAAGFHALEGLRQLIEANLFGNEVVGKN